ncbi:endoglucanase [Streptococcus anginosus]|uniref:glycosyl hydrolase family 8 n=1 Tax=Streptococcus anginosus TaxID=1328 RepID=UPI00195E3ED6|nr:glycosyl hydrolase family 8 [Streptococcus anginosus]QRR97491.1 endoglucanase [Streptococcus anginosus]
MKRTNLRYVWLVAILLAIITIFTYVRFNSTGHLKNQIYQQWSKNYVVQQKDKAYVKTTNDKKKDVVLSESQGYGMVIAVEAAKQRNASLKDFELLYNYYLAHRMKNTQLMSWRQTVKNGIVKAETNNATDGDLYIAYALIQAAKLWPQKADAYHTQARAILKDILTYNYNSTTGVLTVGNWATSDSKYYRLMRTSDVLPAQFQAFYKLTGNKQWLNIRSNMLSKLEMMSAKSKTGLLPDFLWVEADTVRAAEKKAVASKYDGDYYYNACRLPYNLAQSRDKQSRKIMNKMMNFFMKQEVLYAGYTLKGKALSHYQSASFGAPIFYAANRNSAYRKLVQQNKYIFMQDLSKENYYEAAMITLVALDAL